MALHYQPHKCIPVLPPSPSARVELPPWIRAIKPCLVERMIDYRSHDSHVESGRKRFKVANLFYHNFLASFQIPSSLAKSAITGLASIEAASPRAKRDRRQHDLPRPSPQLEMRARAWRGYSPPRPAACLPSFLLSSRKKSL